MQKLKHSLFALLIAFSFQILAAEAPINLNYALDIIDDEQLTYQHLVAFSKTMELVEKNKNPESMTAREVEDYVSISNHFNAIFKLLKIDIDNRNKDYNKALNAFFKLQRMLVIFRIQGEEVREAVEHINMVININFIKNDDFIQKKIEFARKRAREIINACPKNESNQHKKYISFFLKGFCYKILDSKNNQSDSQLIKALQDRVTKPRN